jgi:hypothetical protein
MRSSWSTTSARQESGTATMASTASASAAPSSLWAELPASSERNPSVTVVRSSPLKLRIGSRWMSAPASSRTICVRPGSDSAKRAYSPAGVRSMVTTWPPRAIVSQHRRLRKNDLPDPNRPTAASDGLALAFGPNAGSNSTGELLPPSSDTPSSSPVGSPTSGPQNGLPAARSLVSRNWV